MDRRREPPFRRSPPPHLLRPPPPLSAAHHHHQIIEDRLEEQHREIHSLLLDNQRLAATHVALRQELDVSQHELRLAASVSAADRTESDARVRDLLGRSSAAEEEARSVGAVREEIARARAEAQRIVAGRGELVGRLEAVAAELGRARAEIERTPAIKAEIEVMHQELQRGSDEGFNILLKVATSFLNPDFSKVILTFGKNFGRAAVEYEKKAHAENIQQSHAMEKNMISMRREIDSLRAELADAEKRALAAAAAAAAAGNPGPGFAANYGNPEMGYGGNIYPTGYAMPQVQNAAAVGSQYGAGISPYPQYDVQQAYVQR
ncbi:hypothetical protein QJS10_CPB21g01373 [Acorus calamus]|uniref:Uncharacterized protein n=1 Tax=Acorus calamus TaxID=4465 RepID=A0AAV9C8F8_ACOCL|nr:hypothetical protein QJS10_CPB21g01373 [Acorus calamus]